MEMGFLRLLKLLGEVVQLRYDFCLSHWVVEGLVSILLNYFKQVLPSGFNLSVPHVSR